MLLRMASGLTQQQTLREWLLVVLAEQGGKTPTARALKQMEQRYGSELSAEDWEGTERDKEPKWHNRTRFERKKMERSGFLVPASRSRGVWELTEAGWEAYRRIDASTSVQRTEQDEGDPPVLVPRQPVGQEYPSRAEFVVQRIIRSTAVAEHVKRVHDFTCQICRFRLVTPKGGYAEAAHIQALGRPHCGPDVAANVLCLCPNHHVLFDLGMLSIDGNLTITDHAIGTSLGRLVEAVGHQIGREYLAYHRQWTLKKIL